MEGSGVQVDDYRVMLMFGCCKQTRVGRESGAVNDETPDIDGNDGMTLMGGGNTGRDVIGLLSTSEIMSKGGPLKVH